MLAVVDRADRRQFEFVAIAPPSGRLADALSQRGVTHVPWILRDDDGVKLPREQTRDNLLTAIGRSAPDILHANSLSMGRLTGAIADEISSPTVAHLRDILKLSGAAIADLNRNRRLIAVSSATCNFHIAQGLSADRTRVLYNGVDCEHFQPRPSTGRLKRDLGLDEDDSLAVTIGQIGLRKGQNVLAEAAVISRDSNSRVHYLLVGERNSVKQESIDFERAIVERFAQAGMGNRLHLPGYRTDVAWIMNEADFLIHPALQEPLGRVLLEAAAAGLPIIASDVGGTAEIFEDGRSARLIPPDDSQSLAAAIAEFENNRMLRERLAAAAQRRIRSAFDVGSAARQLCGEWAVLCTE